MPASAGETRMYVHRTYVNPIMLIRHPSFTTTTIWTQPPLAQICRQHNAAMTGISFSFLNYLIIVLSIMPADVFETLICPNRQWRAVENAHKFQFTVFLDGVEVKFAQRLKTVLPSVKITMFHEEI